FFQQLPASSSSGTPDIIAQLTEALENLMVVQSVGRVQMPTTTMFGRQRQDQGTPIVFKGKLLADAEVVYPTIEERFNKYDYTPRLQREGDDDILVALDGIVTGRKISSPAWVHGLLLVITIITTMLSGAAFQGYNFDSLVRQFNLHHYSDVLRILGYGAP